MDINFEEVLNRLNFSEPVDTNEFLKIILNSVDSNFLSDNVKNTLLIPIFQKLESFYKIIDKNIDVQKNDEKGIKRMSEPLGLLELSRENDYNKKLKNYLSKISENLKFLYSKIDTALSNKTQNLENEIKKISLKDFFPSQNIDQKEDSKKEKEFNIQKEKQKFEQSDNLGSFKTPLKDSFNLEQKNINSESFDFNKILKAISDVKIFDLGEKTLKFLRDTTFKVVLESKNLEQKSFETQDNLPKVLNDFLKDFKDVVLKIDNVSKKDKDKDDKLFNLLNKLNLMNDGGSGLFGGLLKFAGLALLGGGIGLFWKDFIKPWVEEKFGISLDITNRVDTLVASLGKWFTWTGVKMGDLSLKLGSKLFKDFSSLISGLADDVFGLIFKSSGEVGKVASVAGAKTGGGIFGKIGSKIAGKFGLSVLKKIPIIGPLISFGFAVSDFLKGDIAGGFLNLASGLVGLIPGVGWILSMAIDGFNSFLDLSTGGATQEERNANKGKKTMDFVKSFYGFVKEIPIIKNIVSFFEGVVKLFSGDFKGALKSFEDTPFGVIASAILSFQDSFIPNEKNEKQFSFSEFSKILKKRVGEKLLKIFPESFGIRKQAAKLLGLSSDENSDDESSQHQNSDQINYNQNKKSSDVTDVKNQKVEDVFIPNNTQNRILFEPSTNVKYELSPYDNVLAYKSDGILDKNLKDLKSILENITANLIDLKNKTESNNTNIINNNMSQTTQGSNDKISFSGKRDPIFDVRMDYWRKFPNERVFI